VLTVRFTLTVSKQGLGMGMQFADAPINTRFNSDDEPAPAFEVF
jgi:hypothetical protein